MSEPLWTEARIRAWLGNFSVPMNKESVLQLIMVIVGDYEQLVSQLLTTLEQNERPEL